MPIKRTNRKQISLSRRTYQRLATFCGEENVTIASVVEYVVRDISGGVPNDLSTNKGRRPYKYKVKTGHFYWRGRLRPLASKGAP
jgi:hypothetical protein